MTWLLAYVACGVFVGFLAGLLGIGGGMTLVPILAALFAAQALAPDHSVHLALGTGMASAVFTSFSSVMAHHRLGSVDWALVLRLVPGVVTGTLAATLASGWLTQGQLAACYAATAGVGALQLLRRGPPAATRTLPSSPVLFAVMGTIGIVSGLLSAGGAFLTVPFMVWCGVPLRTAIGTGAALAWPISAVGSAGFVISGLATPDLPAGTLGFVLLPALVPLVIASILVAPYGARLMHRVPLPLLRRLFALMLLLLALKMAVTYL